MEIHRATAEEYLLRMIEGPRKDTAEEQLLRMIEGTQASKITPTPPAHPMPPLEQFSQWTTKLLASFKARWRILAQRTDKGDVVLHNFQLVSRTLWLILAGLGCYFIMGVLLVKPKHPPIMIATQGAARSKERSTESMTPEQLAKPLAEYLAVALQRNPFTGTSGAASSSAPVRNARERLKELAGGLTVVGIDRGAKPEALVEDTAHQKTYFIKTGDVINGLTVKEISERGVVVSYEGEEILLQ